MKQVITNLVIACFLLQRIDNRGIEDKNDRLIKNITNLLRGITNWYVISIGIYNDLAYNQMYIFEYTFIYCGRTKRWSY